MLRLKEHVARFKKEHSKTFTEKGRICTYLERDFTDAAKLAKKLLTEEIVKENAASISILNT